MSLYASFSDWYRSAGVAPPEGLLRKRWAGVEKLAKAPEAGGLLALVRLFVLPSAREAWVPEGFREAFFEEDDQFPSHGNLEEIKVLAGAVLRCVIEATEHMATVAALGLVCGAFGDRLATVRQPEHVEAANRRLLERARAVRESGRAARFKAPTVSKEAVAGLLPQAVFAGNLPALQDPLVAALLELNGSVVEGLVQVAQALDHLSHIVRVREEELNILWWLQAAFSRDLEKPFSEVGYEAGVLVFPMELADLTTFVPGPETATAVLLQALRIAGAPAPSERASLAVVTNRTPRSWREHIRERHAIDAVGALCPVLLAIHKSLDTHGPDEWLPVYRMACDVSIDVPLGIAQMSAQLYRERLLLRLLG